MPSLEAVEIVRDDSVDPETGHEDENRSTNIPATIMSSEPSATKEGVDADASSSTEGALTNTITPNSPDSSSKKRQQRKVSQQTLSSFFFSSNDKQPSQGSAMKKSKVKTPNIMRSSASKRSNQPTVSPTTQKTDDKKDTAVSSPKIDAVPETKSESLSTEEGKVVVGSSEAVLRDAYDSGELPRKEEDDKTAEIGPRKLVEPRKDVDANTTSNKVVHPSHDEGGKLATKGKKNHSNPSIRVEPNPEGPHGESDDPLSGLPDDRKALLEKHRDMVETYKNRAAELVSGARGGLVCEDFQLPAPKEGVIEISSDDDYPESVVANMAVLIEGSNLSLSQLVDKVCKSLKDSHSHSWNPDSIAKKIKLLAKRKSYLETPGVTVDLFEDDVEDRMWRWEVISIELLPEDFIAKVKKARTERKRLFAHYTSTMRLISSLYDAEKVVVNKSLPKLDTVLAKISRNEEKVLKYERDAEKQRLSQQAKEKKLSQRLEKEAAKEAAAEEKRKEKERKKEEAARKKEEIEKKKQEAAQAREEAKLKKEQEREAQKKKEQEEMEQKKAKLNKQRARMKQFFTAPQNPKRQKTEQMLPKESPAANTCIAKSETTGPRDDFDFRSVINSENCSLGGRPLFSGLSSKAVNSRKRRVRRVSVSVYVTVVPKDAWDVLPFAEQRVIQVRNKYRFLSFHEDCRPPAHSTWSKTSSIVTGTNPFGKDTTHLDYDVDSEAEWEEGDDEVGEDVEDDDKNQDDDAFDEEGDLREYNYEDGFCVADEKYLATDENVDEDTQYLYERKILTGGNGDDVRQDLCVPNRVCIICPSFGGVPLATEAIDKSPKIEGLDLVEATTLVEAHAGMTLQRGVDVFLDAFPQVLVEDVGGTSSEQVSSTSKDEYTKEELRNFSRFVHHCPLNSKDKLIEELRNQYPSVFVSRAKALRKLDSIAIKKRKQNSTGVYWEVNKEVLEELGLQDLMSKTVESDVDESAAHSPSAAGKTTKKAKKKISSATKAASKGRKRDGEASTPAIGSAKKKRTNDDTPEKNKKKTPAPSKASANLMANFLSKGKRTVDKDKSSKKKESNTTKAAVSKSSPEK